MKGLTREQLSAVIYCLGFTLISDRGNMTPAMIKDIEDALDNLQARLYK